MIDKNNFKKIVGIVIDKLEGGYYHPQMLKDGRVSDQRYSNSGETMFGIDRVAGGSINTTPAGIKFWNIIDGADAKNKWAWNYKGGSLAPKLKDLVAEIMYPVYTDNSKRYLSDRASKIVDSDPRLVFNFAYASWNGPGWFKKFSQPINDAVARGIKNKDKLTDIAVKTRVNNSNSLIAQGGNKIAGFIDDLKSFAIRNKATIVLGFLAAGLFVATAAYYLSNKEKINLKITPPSRLAIA